ncbi:MAG: orotidine-5'-phosphate decarboxylase [Myxococcaceae bacterium]|nr:orotidine-5'-phosphate decarboxylase [Myxococcaceae bacterium]
METRERLALAADVPLPEAVALYDRVSKHFGVVKLGLSLFVEHGPVAVRAFTQKGARVFLDLKLHDIPNTVELAAAHAGEWGVAYLTVHASGGAAMVQAAVKGAQAGAAKAKVAPPCVLAVTVLTSLDGAALHSVGVNDSAQVQAERLARLASEAGAGGLVCSAHEVSALRAAVGPHCVVCTPGIRPAGEQQGDQARVATPAGAIKAGADLLVIGRPVYAAADPVLAAERIYAEVASA